MYRYDYKGKEQKGILIYNFAGPCQEPGNAICYLAAFDLVVGDPCCPGTDCLPYPLDSVDNVDNFCQYLDPIQDGDFCGVKGHFKDLV